MSGKRHSWQTEQLERLMTAQACARWPEHRCALLSNPAAEREIDAIVLNELWPEVEQALRSSPLIALTGGGDATPAQALETLHRKFTTRSLTFIIEDPERPAGPRARKPWHCRFEIEAWIEGYFLKKTTILSFPEDFAMAKLTRLLQEPLMQGRPPELSWYEGFDGPGTYSVELSHRPGLRLEPARAGRGAGVRAEDGGRSPSAYCGHGPARAGLDRRRNLHRAPQAGRPRQCCLLKRCGWCSR